MKLWIRVDASLHRDPEVADLAARVGVKKAEAIGLLCCVWGAMAEHRPSGDVSDISPATIEDWAEYEPRGKIKAGAFADAFLALFAADGAVRGWKDRQGKLIERAEKDRARKQGTATAILGTSTESRKDSTEIPPLRDVDVTVRNVTSTSPTAIGAIAECFPGDAQAAFAMLTGMTNGIGTPGMQAVSVEVLQEAMAELRTSGGEITPHRFKSFVGKVLQRQARGAESKAKSNGKGSTTRAMKLIGLIRQRRSPMFPNNVVAEWQEGLSEAEVSVCKTVGITRILNDANEGTMVAQLTRALEESA